MGIINVVYVFFNKIVRFVIRVRTLLIRFVERLYKGLFVFVVFRFIIVSFM